jgi:hypothetical protein
MNPELEAALDVFEDLLATLERNFEEDEALKEVNIAYITQLWRKRMEQQISIANFELNHK